MHTFTAMASKHADRQLNERSCAKPWRRQTWRRPRGPSECAHHHRLTTHSTEINIRQRSHDMRKPRVHQALPEGPPPRPTSSEVILRLAVASLRCTTRGPVSAHEATFSAQNFFTANGGLTLWIPDRRSPRCRRRCWHPALPASAHPQATTNEFRPAIRNGKRSSEHDRQETMGLETRTNLGINANDKLIGSERGGRGRVLLLIRPRA
jgi:hypothetical protein